MRKLDRYLVLLGRIEQIVEAEKIALIERELAFEAAMSSSTRRPTTPRWAIGSAEARAMPPPNNGTTSTRDHFARPTAFISASTILRSSGFSTFPLALRGKGSVRKVMRSGTL